MSFYAAKTEQTSLFAKGNSVPVNGYVLPLQT